MFPVFSSLQTSDVGQEQFYRLDPVRGCFALTLSEAAELLHRYVAFAPKNSHEKAEEKRGTKTCCMA